MFYYIIFDTPGRTLAAASVARVVQRDSEALPPFASMLLGVVPAMPHVRAAECPCSDPGGSRRLP